MSLPPFSHDVNTQYTDSPNASWSFGQKVDTTAAGKEWLEGEKEGWKIIDTEKEDHVKLYQLMISGIVPRPIAFIATISEDGIENLAPFSWFNMVTHNPPIISFACSNGPVHFKDTRTNVTNGLGFTVNIISEPFIEQANSTSIDAPPSFDEWSISGLTKEPAIHVKASRVKESAFSMECELHQAIDITQPTTGAITTTLILARVKYIHVRKDMLNERGNVDATKLKPVGRLGDISYARVGDAFRLPRPIWTQEEDNINGILTATGRL